MHEGNGEVRRPLLLAYHKNECDRKRCTALKLAKFDLLRLESRFTSRMGGMILLDPFAKRFLSPTDTKYVSYRGILVLDCSWAKAKGAFDVLRKRARPRRLPFLVPVNPVNFGKGEKLSSVEAIAATLAITGHWDIGLELLEKFKWGPTFFELNHERLEAYSGASSPEEVEEFDAGFRPQ